MIKKASKILLIIFFVFSLLFCHSVFASSLGELLGQIGESAGYSDAGDVDEDSIVIAAAKIINILLGFLAVIFVILIVYAGFLWMTAGGKEEQVGTAKKILIRSVIGVVIILGSYIIAWFVMSKLSTITEY
ncbi:hypothetical protein K8R61_01830 [bacterium]|nr:hypothetical protein [bacterium]